jgi:ribonuclease HII
VVEQKPYVDISKIPLAERYVGIVEHWLKQEEAIHNFIGCDEAGRGPLAGPVTAAAVYFTDDMNIPSGINDSKKLSPKKREQLAEQIKACAYYHITDIDAARIDEINILQASLEAMKRCVEQLVQKHKLKSALALVDGKQCLPHLSIQQRSVIHGDALSSRIAAASILAKVHRDKIMLDFDLLYPQYGFAKHKGYPTKAHKEAIAKFGTCPIHRMSYKMD